MPTPSTRKIINRDAVGIGIGVASYAVSFGALSVTTGLSVLETQILSAVMFTGASQFALVGVIAAGGTPLAAIAAAWLVGFRNLPYALRMSTLINERGWRRFTSAHITIDESVAMALAHVAESPQAARYAFRATGLSVFVFWNIATLVGSVAAASAGDPKMYGLDSAIVAGFIALIWPQLRNRLHIKTALAAGIGTIVMIPFSPAGIPILFAGAVALLIGLTSRLTVVDES